MEPGANFQELYVSTWKMENTGSRGSEPVTQDPAECGSHSPAAKCTCCRAARWPLLTGQRARRNQEMGSSISRKIIPATSLLCPPWWWGMGEDVGGKEAAKSRQRGKVGGRQHGSQLRSHGDERTHGVYSGISHVIS